MPRKSNQPGCDPQKPCSPEKDEGKQGARRTGPDTGAGRGNDLPSHAPTKKDTREIEGDSVEREVATDTGGETQRDTKPE